MKYTQAIAREIMAMNANMISARKTITPEASAEITNDLYPFLRRYKDGRVERLVRNTLVPASEAPGANGGVATRDVVIDPGTGVSARLFLSVGAVATGKRLPIIVYFHGGGFCTGSAFAKLFHRYAASLSAHAGALVVSVDYRLAPEHPIPAAFEDAWTALRWVTSLSDPWLAYHADHERGVFLAGANIAHNVAALAASPDGDDIDIEGMILLQPFFWGSDRLPSETHHDGHKMLFVPERLDTFWPFLTAGMAGNDDPRMNPTAEVLRSLPCRRALVAVAAKDLARHRGRRYAEWLSDNSECCREVTFVESEAEDHAFHLYRPKRATAVELMDRVVEFINGGERTPLPLPNTTVVEATRLRDPVANLHPGVGTDKMKRPSLANGSGNKIIRVTPTSMPRNALVIGPGKKAYVPRFGRMTMGPIRIFF